MSSGTRSGQPGRVSPTSNGHYRTSQSVRSDLLLRRVRRGLGHLQLAGRPLQAAPSGTAIRHGGSRERSRTQVRRSLPQRISVRGHGNYVSVAPRHRPNPTDHRRVPERSRTRTTERPGHRGSPVSAASTDGSARPNSRSGPRRRPGTPRSVLVSIKDGFAKCSHPTPTLVGRGKGRTATGQRCRRQPPGPRRRRRPGHRLRDTPPRSRPPPVR